MNARDQHLFSPGPKRILSLDGGGVRGAITLAFLEQIEAELAVRFGRKVLLHEYFDLIGGTSTGAIIAGALSLGYSAAAIHEFYKTLAPRVFKKSRWRIIGLQAKFNFEGLQRELDDIVGNRELDNEEILTGLMIVMKRMDTGSPWLVSNNPRSPYWHDPEDGSYVGNRNYKLARLIRASTAAPHYFDPEPLDVLGDGSPGLFVDGGVTPFNNPALALLQHVTLPQYGLNWPFGPDNLTVVSVGTGTFRSRFKPSEFNNIGAIGLAIRALTGLISDNQTHALGLMQWLGDTLTPWQINSEAGDMRGAVLPGGPLFKIIRYDLRLEHDWLMQTLGQAPEPAVITRMRAMDDPSLVGASYELARLAAREQVRASHFDDGAAT
ncbi:patatin-like phospholipase family protein (plasmid) [Agrobacterium vitis]|uniref:patatin-like phospholipase family protein n=1 Tax=Agrobacterium vitis TaxID=373 RepID=UPI003D26B816